MSQSALLFGKGQPDGGRYQNCLSLDPDGVTDTECKQGCCSACTVPAQGTWTLRGICEEEEVLTRLVLTMCSNAKNLFMK